MIIMTDENYDEKEVIEILADKDKAKIISLLFGSSYNKMRADDLLETLDKKPERLYPHILDMIDIGIVKEGWKGFGTPIKETSRVYTLDDKFSQSLSKINEKYPGLMNELNNNYEENEQRTELEVLKDILSSAKELKEPLNLSKETYKRFLNGDEGHGVLY